MVWNQILWFRCVVCVWYVYVIANTYSIPQITIWSSCWCLLDVVISTIFVAAIVSHASMYEHERAYKMSFGKVCARKNFTFEKPFRNGIVIFDTTTMKSIHIKLSHKLCICSCLLHTTYINFQRTRSLQPCYYQTNDKTSDRMLYLDIFMREM